VAPTLFPTKYAISKQRKVLDDSFGLDVTCGSHFVYVDAFKKILNILETIPSEQRPWWKSVQIILHCDAFAPFKSINDKKQTTISFHLAT